MEADGSEFKREWEGGMGEGGHIQYFKSFAVKENRYKAITQKGGTVGFTIMFEIAEAAACLCSDQNCLVKEAG